MIEFLSFLSTFYVLLSKSSVKTTCYSSIPSFPVRLLLLLSASSFIFRPEGLWSVFSPTLVSQRPILPVAHSAILRTGRPLAWLQAKPYLHQVRFSGALQFAHHYQRCQGLSLPNFLWGDEIEYGVFTRIPFQAMKDVERERLEKKGLPVLPPFEEVLEPMKDWEIGMMQGGSIEGLKGQGGRGQEEHVKRSYHYDLQLNANDYRQRLISMEKEYHDLPIGCEWQPEYGSWMIESVPRNPYGSYISDLLNVEKSMQLRRKRLHSVLRRGGGKYEERERERLMRERERESENVSVLTFKEWFSDVFTGDYEGKYDEIAPTISLFPMLGVQGYPHSLSSTLESERVKVSEAKSVEQGEGLEESVKILGGDRDSNNDMIICNLNQRSHSQLLPDKVINGHPRFQTLTENIRLRRGEDRGKVNITLNVDVEERERLSKIWKYIKMRQSYEGGMNKPINMTEIFSLSLDEEVKDAHTNNTTSIRTDGTIDKLYLDAMAFGMGCGCLQVTMQCINEDESRFLHDQLAILGPCLQALSAATPIAAGQFLDTDTRWGIISQAVDDRTIAECGGNNNGEIDKTWVDPQLAGSGVRKLSKSRYSTGK